VKTNPLLRTLVFGLALVAASGARSAPEPFVDGLGSHTRKVTTNSADAQKYFDQGLNLYFGFNHGAAIRAFKEAARLDPVCAMAHWAIALANGPHINFPMVPPPAAAEAWAELTLAQQNAAAGSPVEQALIAALARRYANPQPDNRGPLDKGYADAMREVWKKFPSDTDAGVLFAEAMMDLRPWDQWTPEGQPQPGTDEILATLDAVLKLDVNHPFANHLYIHALEASPHPERALAAADRLRDLQPALAHNVHMPSHIDIRVGHWQEAIVANVKAVDAQQRARVLSGPPHGMLVFYNAHNHQMLTWAAMMTGQGELAVSHVRTMVAEMPEAELREFAMVAEGMAAMPLEVYVRFGRWDDVLAAPDFAEWQPLSRTMRLGARGIAFAAKGDTKSARTAQAAFLEAAKKVPTDEMFLNNPAAAVLAILTPMVDGEILYREGKVDGGLAQLRTAVKAEDALHYDEPPGWILPVRHSLGAVLMQERRFGEAEQVYRDDLARLPENGWSLFGLSESLRYQHKNDEAAALDARFKEIWAKADIPLHSSCLCQPGL
jgi:tetratricopeptide (TPR) repeat protein